MKNILFIHQSAEMYGSDKTLLVLVAQFKERGFNPIVVLPNEGPLKTCLEKENIQVVLAPVFKISRKMFGIHNMLSLLRQITKAIKILDGIHKKQKIDLVYSNTLAVLIGLIYAKKRKLKHVWHVHEIIESPKTVVRVFKKALHSKINNVIIYNSEATKGFWNQNNGELDKKSVVVLNGLDKPEIHLTDAEAAKIREDIIRAGKDEIVIALVGRISRWKGQQLLLEAFNELFAKHKNIRLLFVGSTPPNQEIFLDNLIQKINDYNLSSQVTILPFQDEIAKIWEVIDIAVVPSTEPEPFGLVALEAMLASKPVVGANHGGLKEIVVNNET
ncbi:MAG TPA: glycosyltransferase family 4 protein, partial [Flavobacterium sp.]|uniref:glycosyltransferase family 4 protein n=1 Tax=Flavobacterium sp. TaxID=239 RepID=UPI002BE8B11D